MSFLNELMGNAVAMSQEDATAKVEKFLVPNETVVTGFKLIRDSVIFTSERLVMINVQGLTGKKVSYTSIPYSSVKSFTMESAGTMDLDCEITLSVHSMALPLRLSFKRGTDLDPIYGILSQYTLRDN